MTRSARDGSVCHRLSSVTVCRRNGRTRWRFCCGAFTDVTHNTTTRARDGRATCGRIAFSPAYRSGTISGPALAYVDRNPLRAGMVQWAADYRWSSAAAHLSGVDETGILDVEWWRREGRGADWDQVLGQEELDATSALRRCTYAGRPFGNESFVSAISQRFGRYWERGRPKKGSVAANWAEKPGDQWALF